MLDTLQRSLEAIYCLEPAPNVSHFVLDENALAALQASVVQAERGPDSVRRREQLLIVEEEELFIGLIFDPLVLRDLQESQTLRPENLEMFCLAVEGVSHFLCLMHRARHDRQVTALELELQAEVDKYVAALMLARRVPELSSVQIRHLLYDRIALVENLCEQQTARYKDANSLARRYARNLEERFVHTFKLAAMVRELRRFYRLSYWQKRGVIR
jgi:hypothetical protein